MPTTPRNALAGALADALADAAAVYQAVAQSQDLAQAVAKAAQTMVQSLRAGGRVLFCGNGGSAADAQHLAAEFSGRFYYDRPPLDGEALHVNTSYLTAVGNDYGFDHIYERQVRAKGRAGDVLVGLSTSGNSPNVLLALAAARELRMTTVGMTGSTGGQMSGRCDLLLAAPSDCTPRIQECHILLGHILCQLVEAQMFPEQP